MAVHVLRNMQQFRPQIFIAFDRPQQSPHTFCQAKPIRQIAAPQNSSMPRPTFPLKTVARRALWLGRKSPKDVAPKIFVLCKRKKWMMAQALHDNEWITKLSGGAVLM
jgi:hypothetical protein